MKTAFTEFWITVAGRKRYNGAWEIAGLPKVSKRKPNKTRADQVAVKISVEIPTTYFALPTLSAKVVLPDNAPSRDEILSAVQAGFTEHARGEFGVTVSFEANP